MISRYVWYLREALKTIWVRVVSFAVLAVLAVGLARLLEPFLPEDLALKTGSEAVGTLLGVLTSSMLAVTTFSLSIAVYAFAFAAASATPRATVLLQQDRTTQNVLATFLGAFLYGFVGLIALHANFFDASGKLVVFFFTVVVIGLVVVALIRWIGHLMQFGRMDDTLDRVERAASNALRRHLDNPYLGGSPLPDVPTERCSPVLSKKTGYIENIDMQALQDCAEHLDVRLFVHQLPGALVAPGVPLASVEAASLEEEKAATLCRAFTIGTGRTFEDDPRFGLIVLTEIASRALSPAMNDPGTAIDILGRHVRILSQWRERGDSEVHFENVFVPPITLQEAIEDAFRPIARDGVSFVEVQIRLHKALGLLVQTAPETFGQACEGMAREALERAEAASLMPSELAAIRTEMSLVFRAGR
jgi:uncharacterized membrane protein